MEESIKKKILFVLPPFILTLLTVIWYAREDGRWYTYHTEWEYIPLLICHIIMPIYYFVRLVIATVKQMDVSSRSKDNIFYIIASAIIWIGCGIAWFIFMIFTSGI